MVSQTVYSVVIFSHRFLDSDCINFKTFAFLAVYWPFWTSLYNTDIKVQFCFILILHNVIQCLQFIKLLKKRGICLKGQCLSTLSSSGTDITGVKLEDAGRCLAETVRQYMYDLEVDDGLGALGYDSSDIPGLVKGTLPQVCQSCSFCCNNFTLSKKEISCIHYHRVVNTHKRKFVTWWWLQFVFRMIGPYTREKIRNLDDHCNDDCNSSLACKFLRRTSSYLNTCVHKHKGHVSSASQKMFWMFSRTPAKFAL